MLISKPDIKSKIWRYTDLTKFLSLLHTESLFFCQAKLLDDKYEGSWSLIPAILREDFSLIQLKEMYNHPKGPRAYTAVSCWHLNDEESAAMWKMYALNDHGISIQSTVEKLEKSLYMPLIHQVFMGKINYDPIDVSVYNPRFSHHFMFFYKRKSFEYEQEFRVTIAPQDFDSLDKLGGVYVKVNLEILIEKIYIAPTAPIWFVNLVKSLLHDKYHLEIDIEQSQLNIDPLF